MRFALPRGKPDHNIVTGSALAAIAGAATLASTMGADQIVPLARERRLTVGVCTERDPSMRY